MQRSWSRLVLRAAAIPVAAAAVAACGGVDRGSSRGNIVDAMRAQGIAVDADCVGHVLDGFSDSALKQIDDELRAPASSDPRTRQFLDALRGCAPEIAPAP